MSPKVENFNVIVSNFKGSNKEPIYFTCIYLFSLNKVAQIKNWKMLCNELIQILFTMFTDGEGGYWFFFIFYVYLFQFNDMLLISSEVWNLVPGTDRFKVKCSFNLKHTQVTSSKQSYVIPITIIIQGHITIIHIHMSMYFLMKYLL